MTRIETARKGYLAKNIDMVSALVGYLVGSLFKITV